MAAPIQYFFTLISLVEGKIVSADEVVAAGAPAKSSVIFSGTISIPSANNGDFQTQVNSDPATAKSILNTALNDIVFKKDTLAKQPTPNSIAGITVPFDGTTTAATLQFGGKHKKRKGTRRR